MRTAIAALGKLMDNSEFEAMYSDLDTDNNGTISKKEFTDWWIGG